MKWMGNHLKICKSHNDASFCFACIANDVELDEPAKREMSAVFCRCIVAFYSKEPIQQNDQSARVLSDVVFLHLINLRREMSFADCSANIFRVRNSCLSEESKCCVNKMITSAICYLTQKSCLPPPITKKTGSESACKHSQLMGEGYEEHTMNEGYEKHMDVKYTQDTDEWEKNENTNDQIDTTARSSTSNQGAHLLVDAM